MAVYKLFPEKDATLYSLFPTMNTGLDSQIEATATAFGPSDPNPQVSRFLIQFNNSEMGDVLDNLITSASIERDWKSYLRFYSSKATGLAADTTIDIYLAAKNWNMGTGLYLDDPLTTNGTSWIFTDRSGSLRWMPSNIPSGSDAYGSYTGSFNTSSVVAGGGVWYTSSINGSETYGWALSSSVTFNYRSDLDVVQDVTEMVYQWVGSGSAAAAIPNYGFLVKQAESQEFVASKDSQAELKYFSVDTSTIYPPVLEFRWDDFKWETGSLSVLSSDTPYISLAENPGTFNQGAVNRFRVYSRPEYPTRVFQTSSYYTTNHYLPEGSSYAIKDLDTNEFVINFDSTYTRLSADNSSCYFDVYMNGLEPERYYKILISSSIGGNQYIFDNNYYFKVING